MVNEKNGTRKRRHFDDEFKRDAVQRVLNTGKRCSEVARELGVAPNLLARWKRDYLKVEDQRVGELTRGLTPSEADAEIRRLHRELEDVMEQRDILKKALSVFAQKRRNGSST